MLLGNMDEVKFYHVRAEHLNDGKCLGPEAMKNVDEIKEKEELVTSTCSSSLCTSICALSASFTS